jgi:hypothetical protein
LMQISLVLHKYSFAINIAAMLIQVPYYTAINSVLEQ